MFEVSLSAALDSLLSKSFIANSIKEKGNKLVTGGVRVYGLILFHGLL